MLVAILPQVALVALSVFSVVVAFLFLLVQLAQSPEFTEVSPLRNELCTCLWDSRSDLPPHQQHRRAEPTPCQRCSTITHQCEIRISGLFEQSLYSLHCSLRLSVALGIQRAACNVAKPIQACKL